ncbi:MAG: SPOR domain-containing protein [Betaproteobacteria bacterium]|nr:SPOR domain-containing protein [Betaproteobacteria bacterium]MDE2122961.1 SPOR domain-containing protein [Betaproteobacteria bacterium]MDE2185204.1 SPOR domain-containing protein [Betaproteobacteria bacterium]MDE2325832.1 SPOR domain-containing protein [Betaproteobacteria bacterium]
MAVAASPAELAPPPPRMSASAPTLQTLAPQLPGAPRAYLQTGAFALQANAEAERAQLQAAGIGPVLVVPGILHGAVVYRVQIGPLPGHAPDTALLHKLRLLGLSAYAVVQQ